MTCCSAPSKLSRGTPAGKSSSDPNALSVCLDSKRKDWVSQNSISFWIRLLISHAYLSATNENCKAVKVKAHEVQKIGTSLLFRKNCRVQQMLKSRTWSLQTTLRRLRAFYMQDTFSISHIMVAQKVV